ncbi:hypothetical protein DYB25_005039 [Aphanomyces astaci]|uniref:Uncharacterized protein n=2 Tax=Aphanomyces astaci TaxID=112090 RepID=A0A397FCW4_APHAT|nr:hypothetical protein DYB25_005039 [Aphanomyces astaci]RHZ17085.1 hypothetical protein DYB31_005537 [Aphanomyces astaci]
MVEKLLALAQDETCDDDSLLRAIAEATPYEQKVGKATFWVETGTSLASFKDDQIIAAIFEANQDADWACHLDNFVMVNQPRGGDLVVTVAEEATKLAMIGQTMRILDTSYSVITPPTGAGGASRGLDNRFYVDITNIRYNFDSVELMKALRRLKTMPLFQGFRSTIAGTSCHTNAWRIYFCTDDIPTNLIINNHPVDQLRFQGVTYAVYAKLYTPSRVPKRGGRSHHCLDLDSMFATARAAQEQTSSSKRTRTTNGGPASQYHQDEDTVGADADMGGASNPAPPAEPTPTPDGQLPNPFEDPTLMEVEEYTTPKRTTKRKEREPTLTLADWVTPNFFDDLHSIPDIAKWHVDKWGYTKPITTYRVAVRDVDCSTVSDSLVKRMYIKNKRLEWHPDNMTLKQVISALQEADQPEVSPASQQVQLQEAIQDMTPESLTLAQRVKPEELWLGLHRSPLQGNVTLSTLYSDDPAGFDQTVRLHSWHRWIASSYLPHSTTFLQGFRTIFHDKPSWAYMQAICGTSDFIPTAPAGANATTLLELEDALSVFELWLAVQMNWLHKSDAWLLYLTSKPVVWLPAQRSVRMLSPTTLFALLHSDLGRKVVSQLSASHPGKWTSILEAIISSGYSYQENSMLLFVPGDSPSLTFGTPLLY